MPTALSIELPPNLIYEIIFGVRGNVMHNEITFLPACLNNDLGRCCIVHFLHHVLSPVESGIPLQKRQTEKSCLTLIEHAWVYEGTIWGWANYSDS